MAAPKRESEWVGVVRPPLVALGSIFETIYAALFGWWLDGALWRRSDRQLAGEVKQALPFLFGENKGHIIASDDFEIRRAFDLAVVTVATPYFLIRFVRVRGEFNVKLASTKPPQRWVDLSAVALNGVAVNQSSCSYSSLADVKQLLRTRWPDLQNYWIKW